MTSKPHSAAAKRAPTVPTTPAVKPPCQIHPSAIIADKASITGVHEVEIGENAVIHPYALIRAEGGRVVIGRNSMVYERAVVGVASAGNQDVVVGEGVNIETGSIVEAREVGDRCTIEVNAFVGRGAVLGRFCRVAALERVEAGEALEDFTVVFGDGRRRVDTSMKGHVEIQEARRVGQEKSIELMRKMIPNGAAKWM